MSVEYENIYKAFIRFCATPKRGKQIGELLLPIDTGASCVKTIHIEKLQ